MAFNMSNDLWQTRNHHNFECQLRVVQSHELQNRHNKGQINVPNMEFGVEARGCFGDCCSEKYWWNHSMQTGVLHWGERTQKSAAFKGRTMEKDELGYKNLFGRRWEVELELNVKKLCCIRKKRRLISSPNQNLFMLEQSKNIWYSTMH